MTPEGKVKAETKKVLKRPMVYYHMPVQNGMGAPTLDFVGCRKRVVTAEMVGQEIGEYFTIETKAPGKKPTERQELTMEQVSGAGGKVFVVDGKDALATFEKWLTDI